MVHRYKHQVFYKDPVLTFGDLPLGQEGEVRLVISEDSVYQYTSGEWMNTGIMGTGNFRADGTVPARGEWNLAGNNILNLGQLTSASGAGFSLLSRATDGPTSVVFEIDTVNDITDAAARLLSLKVLGVEKFGVDPNGDIVIGGGLTSTGNVDIFLDSDYDDLFETFTIYNNVDVPTIGFELLQVRANGEVELYAGLKIAKGFTVGRTPATGDISSDGEDIIGVTDTTYPVVVTLSTSDKVNGRKIIVKDESGGASANNITVVPEDLYVTIDGNADETIAIDYDYRAFYSDGQNWFTF